jgi:Protein of unknown function (DUF2782)
MNKTKKVIMMLRTRPSLKLVPLCLLAFAALANAQQTQNQQNQPPSDKPPKLERIEPGSDVPATTIPPRGGTQIKERKQGGQVTEVEVQAGPSHYYMRPNTPAGTAQAGTQEGGATTVRAPQWQVLEFDLNRKRKQGEAGSGVSAETSPAAAEVPPPPRPAGK